MTEDTFQAGDIVRLKSGGPDMTVETTDTPIGYKCQWFAGKKLEWGFFPNKSLVRVKADEA